MTKSRLELGLEKLNIDVVTVSSDVPDPLIDRGTSGIIDIDMRNGMHGAYYRYDSDGDVIWMDRITQTAIVTQIRDARALSADYILLKRKSDSLDELKKFVDSSPEMKTAFRKLLIGARMKGFNVGEL